MLAMAHLFSLYTSGTLGKPYGIKVRCYWELMEPFGNLMRTHKEHLVNKGKKQKNSFACSSQHCYFENFEFACY
jgi:acyl-coenzyme A synthetase/AMP-(fatty) acid ligase